MLVDRHDYHTFQPLLYQLATGLLETTAVGHSLRDLLGRHGNTTIHKASVTAVDLEARTVAFDGLAPISYDYLVFGLGAQVNFFGHRGAAEHAFPMYTLPSRRPAQGPSARALGGRRPGSGPRRRRRPERGRGRAAGRPASRPRERSPSSTGRAFAKDYRNVAEEDARITLVEAGPSSSRCSSRSCASTRRRPSPTAPSR